MPDGSPRTPYRGKGGRGRGRTGWMEREGGRRRRRRDGGREAQPDGSVARASERAGAFIHLPDCPKRPRRYTLVRVRRPILQRILANIFATRRLGRFFYSGICSPLFELDNFTFLSIFQAIKWPNALYGRSKSSDKRQVSQMLPFHIVVCSWAKYKI